MISNLPNIINTMHSGSGGQNINSQMSNYKDVSLPTQTPHYPRSKSILDHLQDCKRENNERLKQVKNLDDLVMFKLTTVADKIKEEQGPENADLLSLDMFQKICDPLLAVHNNFHQLPKKAYINSQAKNGKKNLQMHSSVLKNSSVMESHYSQSFGKNEAPEQNKSTLQQLSKETTGILPAINNSTSNAGQDNNMSLKRDSHKSEPRKCSAGALLEQANIHGSQDPIKFLQQYFKAADQSGKKGRKVHHANYMMEKLEKKYGSGSVMALNKRVSALSSMGLASEASPRGGLPINRHLMLNQMSEIQSLSHFVSSQPLHDAQNNNMASKVVHQGGASFYSFAKLNPNESQPNMSQAETSALRDERSPQNINSIGVGGEQESMNILNFNKMKDELQKLFDMDQSSMPSHALAALSNNDDEHENSYLKDPVSPKLLMRNQRLLQNQEDSYQRNVQFRSLIRSNDAESMLDPSPSTYKAQEPRSPSRHEHTSLPPIAGPTNFNQTPGLMRKPTDANDIQVHSSGKVTFGKVRQQNSPLLLKEDDSALLELGGTNTINNYREYFNEYAMMGSLSGQQKKKQMTKEEKIRQILMNEIPDAHTMDNQLHYLSKIQQVRSLGFDKFRDHVMQIRVENAISLSKKPTERPRLASDVTLESKQHQQQQYIKSVLDHQSRQDFARSLPPSKQLQQKQQIARDIESDLMRFNMNKNFEKFQENLQQKKKLKALTSMELMIMSEANQHHTPLSIPSPQILVPQVAQLQQQQQQYLSSEGNKSNNSMEGSNNVSAAARYYYDVQQNAAQEDSMRVKNHKMSKRNLGVREYQSQRVTNRGGQGEEIDNDMIDQIISINQNMVMDHNEHHLLSEDQHPGMHHHHQHHIDPEEAGSFDKERLLLMSGDELASNDELANSSIYHLKPTAIQQPFTQNNANHIEVQEQEIISSPQHINPVNNSVIVNKDLVNMQHPTLPPQPQKVSFIKKRSTHLAMSNSKDHHLQQRELIPTTEIVIDAPPLDYHSGTRSQAQLLQREVAVAASSQNLDGIHQSHSELLSNNQQSHGKLPVAATTSVMQRKNTSRYFKMMKQQQRVHQQLNSADETPANVDNHSYLMLEQFSDELQNQLIDLAMSKRKAWSPRRYKKFPRFTIFLNRNQSGASGEDPEHGAAKEYLKQHVISLNPDFMNMLLNQNNPNQTNEQAIQQIEQALASINYPQRERSPAEDGGEGKGYRFQDPFDRVLLTKGIDNQILTSFRTLTKANNVVSDTLKIVHTKFNPTPIPLKIAARMKKAYKQHLYVINEEVFSNGHNHPEDTQEDEGEEEQQQQHMSDDRDNSLDRLRLSGEDALPLLSLPNDDSHVQLLRNSHQHVNSHSNMLQTIDQQPSVITASQQNLIRASHNSKSIVYQQQPGGQSPARNAANHHQSTEGGDDIINGTGVTIENPSGGAPGIDTLNAESKESPMAAGNSNGHSSIMNIQPDRGHIEPKPLKGGIPSTNEMDSKKQRKTEGGDNQQKSTIVLQKIDPSEMFGMTKTNNLPVFTKTLQNTNMHYTNNHSNSGGGDTLHDQQQKWSSNPYYYEQPRDSYQPSSLQQRSPMHSNSAVQQQKQQQQVPLKKKIVSYAGGFQAYNMHSSNNHYTNANSSTADARRYSNGAMQTMKQVLINAGHNESALLMENSQLSMPPQQFLESLNDQEKAELTKKLIMPPQQSKLKHMIDDLYQKEKKYVKQYLREDYIENNNFIFDLQKSHALHTTKLLYGNNDTESMPTHQQFIGGLYSIGQSAGHQVNPSFKNQGM